MASGWRALDELKRAGLIKAIGAGINEKVMLDRWMDRVDLDFFLVALPYTLLDQAVLDHEFPRVAERDLGVIIGAVFASGILATGPVEGSQYAYAPASAEIRDKTARIEAVCARHEVPLPAAAMQFPLGHPAVAAVIPGAFNADQVQSQRRDVPPRHPGGHVGRAQARGSAASRGARPRMSRLVVDTATDRLAFDGSTGRLVSVRHRPSGTELVAASPTTRSSRWDTWMRRVRFRSADDRMADAAGVRLDRDAPGTWRLTTVVRGVGGLALDATVTVRGGLDDRFAYWSVALDDRTAAGLRLTHVAFPWVAVPVQRGGDARGATAETAIVRPFGAGQLLRGAMLDDLEPDAPAAFELRPESFDCLHYPGYTFAQFLAASRGRAGLMVAARDAGGRPKIIKPLATRDGRIRLGFAHLGDPRDLDYEVAIGGFTGDWEDAAALYRDWALTQPWASRPLGARDDVPAWLLDSPAPVVIRAAGSRRRRRPDHPERGVRPVRARRFLRSTRWPTRSVGRSCRSSWPGSAKGRGSTRRRSTGRWQRLVRGLHRARHATGAGTSGRSATGPAGWSAIAVPATTAKPISSQAGGPESVTRTSRGEPWEENWDASWRPSYPACLAVPRTREIAHAYVATLAGELGLDMIQFFDQNLGGCTFPCYAEDHPHASVPGPWMTATMTAFMAGRPRDGL